MNAFAITFLLINVALLLRLSRRWASLPLLIGACYMTMGQVIEVGPLHFTVIRMLVAAGVLRVIIRGEHLAGGMNALDRLMLAWAAWMLISSLFHNDFSGALIYRLGLVYDACGIYFLLRVFCQSFDDVVKLCYITAILLVPVAVEMVYEKVTMHNLFSVLGGILESPEIRGGKIRAQGPFSHSILAGTVGAVSLPLMIGLWQQHRKASLAGIMACATIIFASTSSGPIMSAMAGIVALFMWHHRLRMRVVRWLLVMGYIALDLVMQDRAFFIIARIDLTGGSTGWYRARLLESAFEHIREWWFAGTDYTRNWMEVGVSWNPNHTDITNHYLQMGVTGGLPLMLLFIAILAKGFSFVGQMLRTADDLPIENLFIIWTFGASLFAHATTFISVSYFDQSFVFLYLTLASIGSASSRTVGVPDHSMSNSQVLSPLA
jgi:hypothetical protein